MFPMGWTPKNIPEVFHQGFRLFLGSHGRLRRLGGFYVGHRCADRHGRRVDGLECYLIVHGSNAVRLRR